MSACGDDLERRLVPRWRFSNENVRSEEFVSDPRWARSKRDLSEYLEAKVDDWHLEKSTGTAIELVSCGLSIGVTEEVRDAAEFLQTRVDELTPQMVAISNSALMAFDDSLHDFEAMPILGTPESKPFDDARLSIASAKLKIVANPRNVLAWLDMSRAYTILGVRKKAISRMNCAL